MAQQIKRAVSAQESTISQEESSDVESSLVQVDERYECPICINWLNEPVLTSCGHRFCKKCITSWLKKPNAACPIDNKPIHDHDIFPDNFTRREILQIRKPCPNMNLGCEVICSPLDLDAHLAVCGFKKESKSSFECLFKQFGCKFVGATKENLDDHSEKEFRLHLQFLMNAFNRSSEMQTLETDHTLWDPPSKSQNGSEPAARVNNHDELIKRMYERIVFLEQCNREQNIRIENLVQEMGKLGGGGGGGNGIDPRHSNGVIVWQIRDINRQLEMMASNQNHHLYSNEAYTSPYGYRFCVRLNISPKSRNFISLHIHLMQSENDYHLDWPFLGRIKIILVHPRDYTRSRHDTIMSNPDILAFHRPRCARGMDFSPRGYGFLEYACIEDLFQSEFIANDTLVIKVQTNIV